MSRSRGWCFTVNNPPAGLSYDSIECAYIVVGDEHGELGTHHHQGYVYFANAKAFNPVKKLLPEGAHIEAAKGSPRQAAEYCKKEKVFYEAGECPAPGRRTDVETVRQMVDEGQGMRSIVDCVNSFQAIRAAEVLLKYKEKPRDWEPKVLWFYGPTGSGKTREAFSLCKEPWVSGRSLKWWEGYDAHENVIIDDFRGDFCTFHELLRILDRYEYRVETKGGSRQLRARLIVITCPCHPSKVYPNCGERIDQLLRRITEVRAFGDVCTEVFTQRSRGNTDPGPGELEALIDELDILP